MLEELRRDVKAIAACRTDLFMPCVCAKALFASSIPYVVDQYHFVSNDKWIQNKTRNRCSRTEGRIASETPRETPVGVSSNQKPYMSLNITGGLTHNARNNIR